MTLKAKADPGLSGLGDGSLNACELAVAILNTGAQLPVKRLQHDGTLWN